MAVLSQLGWLAEAQMRALMSDSGAFPSSVAAAGNNGYQQFNTCAGVVSAAQSELTCNVGSGGGGVVLPSRKRGREAGIEHKFVSSSAAALLPVPGMLKEEVIMSLQEASTGCQTVDQMMPSTCGRPAEPGESSVADCLVSELCWQGAEIDALVREECSRLRAGLEHARKRQRQALLRAVAGAASRTLREKEAQLGAARRRAAELEERVRQAAAESQAWRGLASGHEAVAAGLRATLDRLLLLLPGGADVPAEGFGETDPAPAVSAADDGAQSRCCIEAAAAPLDTTTSPPAKWACKACGGREASVLLLPCRHLCLCKACELRLDACPVCLAVKNASIHIAEN